MKITKVTVENYRGIKEKQDIPLANFSSIVGKNDSGKSIILNAIVSFLDPKSYPITEHDFNNYNNPIVIECSFCNENLEKMLELKIKSKIKKDDGLNEFLVDILPDGVLTVQKTVSTPKKGFDVEKILMRDFKDSEFSLLYSKSDEELSKIIEDNSISIPVSGTGRNSKLEKIKHIKEFCSKENKGIIERFIPDDYKINSLLPGVELFVSDYGLEADTSFKTNSLSEIRDYFIEQTSDSTKKLSRIQKEIKNEMAREAESVKNYMSDYADIKKVEISPNFDWPKAIPSVDVSFQLKDDAKPIPMTHKGAGCRRLFMVARFRYLAKKKNGENIIYLIEEPETFLHPSAQEDLLNALKDLSEDNQIIVATHSPIFAGATKQDSIILCKKENQSTYECLNEENKSTFIPGIVSELGIKPSFNLMDRHEKIVFVESGNDAKFYDLICKKCIGTKLLNNDKILLLPFGGGEDIDSFLNINYFDSSDRDLYLIIDSDKHLGDEIVKKQQKRSANFNSKKKGESYILKKSCIENYYHPRALERMHDLEDGVFDFFSEYEDVKKTIKKIKQNNKITKCIKEKNNIDLFESMKEEEWREVVEQELLDFLKCITS
ncbi:MAG: AAA family ATPase [Candidatus Moranbacteria bacterium]|nr:AAA family ATPase [Candidatus Moranbacteria bacterium]